MQSHASSCLDGAGGNVFGDLVEAIGDSGSSVPRGSILGVGKTIDHVAAPSALGLDERVAHRCDRARPAAQRDSDQKQPHSDAFLHAR